MKLGIAVKNLGPHQLAYYAIKNINLYCRDRCDMDCILFYENQSRPCLPMNFATMQIFESYCYDGIMVATCLSTADKVIKSPGNKKRFFYVWDLEWIRFANKHFNVLHGIYAHPSIQLIARSESHKKLIEDCWNVKVKGVVDDLNIESLIQCLN